MSAIVFHKAPHVGAQVTLTYFDAHTSKSFTLLTFTGDGYTNRFDFKVNLDAHKIIITVDGVLQPSTEWTWKDDQMQSTNTKNKSVILFNTEKLYGTEISNGLPTYRSPFTISDADSVVSSGDISRRIDKVLAQLGYTLVDIDWSGRAIIYYKG